MASSGDIFNTVRNSVDIVEIIAEHLVLKKAGKEYKALCPFHDDHRPSMAVVPQKQIFHCFVCGMGGDVFKFVMNYHKMTWAEALKYLAQKGGVKVPELPRYDSQSSRDQASKAQSIREQITQTNERACAYFENLLQSDAGKAGMEYFQKRGLTPETLQKFRLGYSPEGWTGLCTAASRVSVGGDALYSAGLAKRRSDGSFYDVFRGRVMFPILDSTSRVIAFGGRVLVEKRDENGDVVEAKYLNSPETAVFVKSEALYGLNLAKAAIIKAATVVVVEGYMDVIACHQAGVTNVVATLGTALTPEHARILRRLCQTVVLVFDSDDAGYRAADRAMETFVREPLDVKIASVPDGKDPCDFCMAHGGDAFAKVVANATDAMTYQWRRLQKQFNATDSLSARQQATTQFMRFVATAMFGDPSNPGGGGQRNMDPIRRGMLIDKIGDLAGMSADEVKITLKRLSQQQFGNRVHQPAAVPNNPVPQRQEPHRSNAEGWVLGALLAQPTLYDTIREDFSLDLFSTYQPLANKVMEYLEHATDLSACSIAEFISGLNSPELSSLAIRLEEEMEAGGKVDLKLQESWKRLLQQQQLQELEAHDPADEFKGLANTLNTLRAKGATGEIRPGAGL